MFAINELYILCNTYMLFYVTLRYVTLLYVTLRYVTLRYGMLYAIVFPNCIQVSVGIKDSRN